MAEKKYVEVNALFKTVEDYASTHPIMNDNELFALFCSIPAADVRPVVRGKWVYNDGDNIPYCSECIMPQDSECNFCPNCGADMMEE